MAQWYCGIGGQQYGPVDEQVLRAWIGEGRVGPDDLIWTQGMPQWTRAATIMPEMFPQGGGFGGAAGLVPAPPPGGTDGRAGIGELMSRAGDRLRGRWGLAIGFFVLFGLINGAMGAIPYLNTILQLILSGPFELGVATFGLAYARAPEGQPRLGMLFAGFNRFGTALGAYLLRALLIAGWTLLFASVGILVLIVAAVNGQRHLLIVGGLLLIPAFVVSIVKTYAYSQTMYLIADDPMLGALDAITASRQMMDGNKGRLFGLNVCLFLPLILAGMVVALLMSVTTGVAMLLPVLLIIGLAIGMLWYVPWMQVTLACFHDDLHPPAGGYTAGVGPGPGFAPGVGVGPTGPPSPGASTSPQPGGERDEPPVEDFGVPLDSPYRDDQQPRA